MASHRGWRPAGRGRPCYRQPRELSPRAGSRASGRPGPALRTVLTPTAARRAVPTLGGITAAGLVLLARRAPESASRHSQLRRSQGTHAVPEDAERCGLVLVVADRREQALQALWLCAAHPRAPPDCHGKDGVAGSSPAESSRKPRYDAVFLFRSGSDDHFPGACWREGVEHGRRRALRGGFRDRGACPALSPRM